MAQTLPPDETFAAPKWLVGLVLDATDYVSPWYFWYLGFDPNGDVGSADPPGEYPFREDGEMESRGLQLLFIDNNVAESYPALMTDLGMNGPEDIRSVLCRVDDALDGGDINYTVTFRMSTGASSAVGSSFGGSGTASPTAGGRFPFPRGDTASTDINHTGMGGTHAVTVGNYNPIAGPARGVTPGGGTPDDPQLWMAWLGNALYFRAGTGSPKVRFEPASDESSRRWYCTKVDHYSLCAYPVVNAGDNRVDLYAELWLAHSFNTSDDSGDARRLIRQVIDGGVSGIDFSNYSLRVTCETNGSDVDLNAYLGHSGSEQQLFKDDVFGNNDYVVPGSGVTHTAASGLVKDTGTGKITTSARTTFGWGMGRDRTINIRDRLTPDGSIPDPFDYGAFEAVASVDVSDLSAGTVIYRDEFKRSVTGTGTTGPDIILPVSDNFTHTGNSVNGLFTFDAYTSGVGGGNNEIRRLMLQTSVQDPVGDPNDPNDYVTLDYDAVHDNNQLPSNVMRVFVHERPSTQFFNHHRSVDFRAGFESASAPLGNITYEFGIMLRGSFNGNTFNGLTAYLTWGTNGMNSSGHGGTGSVLGASMTLAYRNVSYDSAPNDANTTVIARHTLTAGEITALDLYPTTGDPAFKTFDFRAEAHDNGTAPDALALYEVTFGGITVNFDDPEPPSQSLPDPPHQVPDLGPQHFSGRQEGFWFRPTRPEFDASGNLVFNPPQAKLWTEGALKPDPVSGDGPDSQVSIVVGGEGTPVGELNTSAGALGISGGGIHNVEVEVTVESSLAIRRIPFGSGHAYTSPAASKARRRWRVIVRAASLGVYQSLQTFFNDHSGMEVPFAFVVPISDDGTGSGTADETETVNAWFTDDTLVISEVAPKIYDIAFSVEELIVA